MRAALVIPDPSGGKIEIRDVEKPVLTAGNVIVRVKAAGLNRGEVLYRRASLKGRPYIGGVEFAGEIAAVGDGVTGLVVGQRVMGHGVATQAEYVSTEARALMTVPDRLSWVEAAAFPNVFVTAHDAIVTAGAFRSGECVLVNAAASGIGTAAIQIARVLGAKAIVGTSRSREKVQPLFALGLTHVAVASEGTLSDTVKAATSGRGVDLVIDQVGGSTLAESLELMALRGRLVNIGRMGGRIGELDMDRLSFNGLKLIGVSFRARSRAETLDCIEACSHDLLPHLAAGSIKVPIARTFALADIATAHAFAERDTHVGKIVLTID